MPPELIYVVCIFATFSTLDEFSSLFTRLNIAHDSYTFHETFISAIAFLLKLNNLSLSSFRSLKRVTSIASFVFHRRKRIMQVWNDMRASTTISVSYCLLSVCKDQHLLRGWFIMSHYSKVCKRFFTFPFFMQVESDWLLLFSWNLKQGYYS